MRPLKFKGSRVYVNRPILNEAAAERLAINIERGWYSYESTSDGIEVYVLTESCPFRRRDITKDQMTASQIITELVTLAANREFDGFVEGVNELAYVCKVAGLQNADFVEAMSRIESMAVLRSGNKLLPYEIRKHLELARQKRNGTILVI